MDVATNLHWFRSSYPQISRFLVHHKINWTPITSPTPTFIKFPQNRFIAEASTCSSHFIFPRNKQNPFLCGPIIKTTQRRLSSASSSCRFIHNWGGKSERESEERERVQMEGIKHRTINVNGINLHIAEKGEGPLILFLHGFPELWYSWRHQILGLSSLGYRAVAPDLRGYGDTDAPASPTSYTSLHVVGDLIALLDAIAADEEKVFVVGHDWGAIMAWALCLYRPDRVKALVNLSVAFTPRNPKKKPLQGLRALYGDDYYICRIQEAGEIEAEFAQIGTERILKNFLTYRNPGPLYLPKGKGFGDSADTPIVLPSWLTEDDVHYYTSKYEKRGFTGGLNYYRDLDLNWELTAPWTGTQIKVPAKFIVGDLDLTYNGPGTKEYIHNGGFKKYVPFLQEVVVMEGVAHFIHEEKPDEINTHIYEFIKKF